MLFYLTALVLPYLRILTDCHCEDLFVLKAPSSRACVRTDADVPPFGLATAAAVMHGNNGENILPLYDLLPCAQLQQGVNAFGGQFSEFV